MKYSHYFRSRAHSFRNSVFMILFGLLMIPVMTASAQDRAYKFKFGNIVDFDDPNGILLNEKDSKMYDELAKENKKDKISVTIKDDKDIQKQSVLYTPASSDDINYGGLSFFIFGNAKFWSYNALCEEYIYNNDLDFMEYIAFFAARGVYMYYIQITDELGGEPMVVFRVLNNKTLKAYTFVPDNEEDNANNIKVFNKMKQVASANKFHSYKRKFDE